MISFPELDVESKNQRNPSPEIERTSVRLRVSFDTSSKLALSRDNAALEYKMASIFINGIRPCFAAMIYRRVIKTLSTSPSVEMLSSVSRFLESTSKLLNFENF